MALQYAYGFGAYGVGQYATSVFAVSSTTAIADADALIVRDAAATTGSVSGGSAQALLVRISAGTAESSSGTSANAWRVRDGEATADATSAINDPIAEVIFSASFFSADASTATVADGLRIGTSGATVATDSASSSAAERIQQPSANAASFSGQSATAFYTARGLALSQTTVSASASTGRIVWAYITPAVSEWAPATSTASNWDDVTDNATANWQTLGANGLPLAA
jgi:hypothetical protein